MTNNDLFTKYINADLADNLASECIREAIVSTVIANTASATRVDEDFYSTLLAEAKTFAQVSRVMIIDRARSIIIKDFCFIGSARQIRETLQKLADAITEYGVWYEDTCSVTIKDQSYDGFCWGEFFLGYPVLTEFDDNWDNEAVAPFNPKFAAAQQQLGEYEDRWRQILKAKQGGNSTSIEDIKTLKKNIAELRDTTVYGEVRDGADKLMSKIEKWNIN